MTMPQKVESIARRTLHEEIVERLQDLIVDGTLPAGGKVPEKELCLQFGVSRTPMREALKVLAADGLVSLEPNRGAWIRSVTLEEMEDVFPVMGALEALSGELACRNVTDEQIEQIQKTHLEMVRHYERKDRQAYFRTNQRIHELILEAADNAVLAAQYQSLATRIRRARYIANMSDERWEQAVEEHATMLAALEDRDGKKLAAILKQHLQNKFETVCRR